MTPSFIWQPVRWALEVSETAEWEAITERRVLKPSTTRKAL